LLGDAAGRLSPAGKAYLPAPCFRFKAIPTGYLHLKGGEALKAGLFPLSRLFPIAGRALCSRQAYTVFRIN